MASDRQFAANRRNAKRSTGPKSEQGKAKSSRNSLKHGLTAEQILLDDENPQHFEAFCEQLRSELKPVGIREEMCVDRLAQLQLRLRRVPGYEAAILKWMKQGGGHHFMNGSFETLPNDIRNALLAIAFPTDAFGKLDRHEAHLARQVQMNLEQLSTLQKERLATLAAEATLIAPNVGQVINAVIVAPATPLISNVIEGRALTEPQVQKSDAVAPKHDLPTEGSIT